MSNALTAAQILQGHYAPLQGGSTKHACMYQEFGWQEIILYSMYRHAYERIGIARGGITVLHNKAFESAPSIYEGTIEDDSARKKTEIDKQFERFCRKTNLMRTYHDVAIRRSVGAYAGMLIQAKDGQTWDKPLTLSNPSAVVRFIPVWQDQLIPSKWDSNPISPTYGEPLEFSYLEYDIFSAKTTVAAPARALTIDKSRVIWFGDIHGNGSHTVLGTNMLRPGMNALMNLEKIEGSSGEGFYKNAARLLSIAFDGQVQPQQLFDMMGAKDATEFGDRLQEIGRDVNYNFDAVLALMGARTEVLSTAMDDPRSAHEINVNAFAASMGGIPSKHIVGNQEGDLASGADHLIMAKLGKAYRDNVLTHELYKILEHLQSIGLWQDVQDWAIEWQDLVDDTPAMKLEVGKMMEEINELRYARGADPLYSDLEIRNKTGYEEEVKYGKAEQDAIDQMERDMAGREVEERIDIDV